MDLSDSTRNTEEMTSLSVLLRGGPTLKLQWGKYSQCLNPMWKDCCVLVRLDRGEQENLDTLVKYNDANGQVMVTSFMKRRPNRKETPHIQEAFTWCSLIE